MSTIKVILAVLTLATIGCAPAEWSAKETLLLDDVSAIGIAQKAGEIWLSDGNNNRMVQINDRGEIIKQLEGVERPMHIYADDADVYIPSYGSDAILIMRADGAIDTMTVDIELEAPASVDIDGARIAIADFYNHRVVYYNGTSWMTIGTEGKGDGELYYPTDVEFHDEKIYVADAYNNRAQVFDLDGNHLLSMGAEHKIRAATGIKVTDYEVFLTDFENDRVVIMDHTGKLIQILDSSLNKPTDIDIINGQLWVLNFKGKYISVLEKE